MTSCQNKTLHSVVMSFIPKKVTSNNPPIIKTSLPNLDKPLSNESIKLTYDNICNVIINDVKSVEKIQQSQLLVQKQPSQPAVKPSQLLVQKQPSQPAVKPSQLLVQKQPAVKPSQLLGQKQPQPAVKPSNMSEPVQTTLDNYVSVAPKRLTKSAKVSVVSPPIIQPQQRQTRQHRSLNHRGGKTFDDEPPIYHGKNPFHEITLKARKTKKSKKKSKKSKKSKSKKKEKRIRQIPLLAKGGNSCAREIISTDIQNMMSF